MTVVKHTRQGFYINTAFLIEHKDLSATQVGILVKLFDLLNQNEDMEKWGYLVGANSYPMKVSRIKMFLGTNGYALAHKTWDSCIEEYLKREIFIIRKIGKFDCYYSMPFVKMNPSDRQMEVLKNMKIEEAPKFHVDYFTDSDPFDQRADRDLNDWEWFVRQWVDFTTDVRTKLPRNPFPADWDIVGKRALKQTLLQRIQKMGRKNVYEDMALAFDQVQLRGGSINSMAYFSARWTSRDWLNRNLNAEKKQEEPQEEHDFLKEEIMHWYEQGKILTKGDLLEMYPRVNETKIKKIAKDLGLR